MSNCEKYLDLISAYFDGEVTDAEKTEIEAHFEECAECRSVLETYREMSAEIFEDTEEVPEGFAAGVMEKVTAYEKSVSTRKLRKNFGIAGRWVGIAACIAIILVAFPRMPGLGCGSSMNDAAMESTSSGAAMGGNFGGIADASPGEPESSVEYSYTDSDGYADDVIENITADAEESDNKTNSGAYLRADIGMIVTLYGEIPEELKNSEYEVTYYENGDTEYLVPVNVARDIAAKYDNAEVEVLDTKIDGMMAKIIIRK